MESSLHKNPHSRRNATCNWIYIRGREEEKQTLTTPHVHETYNNENGNRNDGDKNEKKRIKTIEQTTKKTTKKNDHEVEWQIG